MMNLITTLDCETVRIFAYSRTSKQPNKRPGVSLKTESETGENAKNMGCPFCIRYIRLHYPPLPAKFWHKLLTSCQDMFPTSHSRCSLPWWIHCSLACSVFLWFAKASHRSFYPLFRTARKLLWRKVSFVEDNEKLVYQKVCQLW